MTDKFLKSLSFIFHPLFMPLLGVIFYFSKTPRFVAPDVVKAKLISLFILTILLPILLYFFLKVLGKVKSFYLTTTKERVYPLLLNCIINLIIIQRILPPTESIELYFFFLGILISSMTCLMLAIMKFKASIHLIGISGLTMFFIALSVHFSINIVGTLSVMTLVLGAVATSRLHVKAHVAVELVVGFFIGVLPQLILIPYWL
ncbi:hypothetical protein KFZ70_03235 [Tamlana fucoidanivorans]|uniref:Uncharacterized protein n=1 Tax=Allotamlana fucoidanivorans TaxID=2583814 RepID=A0A5C4SKC5_9FLAO|nr:hypothetical protein [Tamlana fucoidanivorans]TNJ44289.1 hypothetical protein FGF67_09685 [Tamlana fucoidanivorans]